jgi:MoaA/NifB/PqqE/SkfB family radical SAM enzyme
MNNLNYLIKSFETIFNNKVGRKIFVHRLSKKLYKTIVENVDSEPRPIRMRKYEWSNSLLHRAIINIDKGYISKKVLDNLVHVFIEGAFHSDRNTYRQKLADFEKEHGVKPPSFLVISPTQRCNLRCTNCYASSDSKTTPQLSFKTVDRMVKEIKEDASGRFIVLSGGEPLMYKDGDKTMFDLFEKYNDIFFMFYTNGTLIDDAAAMRLQNLGNAIPAISIEGYESETDNRRGKGVFKKILGSIDNLRKYGVPFIFSVTGTTQNINILLSDKFYEYCFDELGATFMWQFQLMPMGRGKSAFKNVPDAEQRLKLFRKWESLLKEKKYPLADFWNGGMLTNGCIAYGRQGGYLHINWKGDITPCVFVPYAIDNVNKLYAENKTLLDALKSPIMVNGRKWQQKTQLENKMNPENLLMPCSIRDHYDNFRKHIITPQSKGIDNVADDILLDEEYYNNMINYDKALKEVTQKIWEQEYLT